MRSGFSTPADALAGLSAAETTGMLLAPPPSLIEQAKADAAELGLEVRIDRQAFPDGAPEAGALTWFAGLYYPPPRDRVVWRAVIPPPTPPDEDEDEPGLQQTVADVWRVAFEALGLRLGDG